MPPTSSVIPDTISAERLKISAYMLFTYSSKSLFRSLHTVCNFFLWVTSTRHGTALACNFNVKVSVISMIYYPYTISTILGVIFVHLCNVDNIRGILEPSTILLRSNIGIFRWSTTAFLSLQSASY